MSQIPIILDSQIDDVVTERLTRGVYDEAEIADHLATLPSVARALFACACAERLMAAFRWSCGATGFASYEVVREALDAAWSNDEADPAAGGRDVAELVPDDDDGRPALGSAVTQNAVACVAYALEVRRTGEVQAAAWAARQLYEAADSVVQQGAPAHSYVGNVDQEPPVQLMVRGIHAALLSASNTPPADLHTDAQADGETFLGFVQP